MSSGRDGNVGAELPPRGYVAKAVGGIVPPFVFFVILVILWQLAITLGHIKPFILPTPLSVVTTLLQSKWHWGDQLFVTSIEVLGGFALSVVVGILLGIAIMWSRLTRRAILPFVVFLNTLPKIALAPLFIVWLGYGIIPNIFIAFITAFFPIVVSTAAGIEDTDPDMINLARLWGLSRWKTFIRIQIPNATPHIFSGVKVASSMAVIGAIIGEFIASTKGLASIIMNAQASLATNAMFAALVWISLLGLALYGIVVLVQRLLMPWANTGG